MATRAKQINNLERDTKTLITQLTGFDEDEENFTLCYNFAASNFKFHRFLDPDSHRIHRAIDGLIEKFHVHAEGKTGDILDNLVKHFLESPIFEGREKGKTDTHYAVLSLLTELNESPTAIKYTEPPPKPEPEVDTFDWGSYLKEGIEIYNGPFPDSPDWSEEEDTLEETRTKSIVTFRDAPDSHLEEETFHDLSSDDLDVGTRASDWLEKHLVVQYWSKPVHISLNDTSHRASNLSVDWEAYLSNVSGMYVPPDRMLVTEHQIMRETLWLLNGVKDSVIYHWTEDGYKPNSEIKVTHLANESLQSLLSHLAKYGTIVRHLYDFVETVTQSGSFLKPLDERCVPERQEVCQTYQAFSSALCTYLQGTQRKLLALETIICHQDDVTTLAKLLDDLSPLLAELDVLDLIYTNGLAEFGDVTSHSQKASGLLGALFEALLESDNMGEKDIDKLMLLLPLWIKSSKPYLDIIDLWISHGELVDPLREFIIHRNIDIRSLDENFWDTAFTLHCMERPNSEPSTTSQGTSSGPAPTGPTQGTSSGHAHWAPRFLLPVLQEIILGGKSMELIQNLGKLGQVVGSKKRESLYETFITSLEETLGSAVPDDQPLPPNSNIISMTTSGVSLETVFNRNIATQMRYRGVWDPLLRINFRNIFNSDCLQVESLNTQENLINSRLESLRLDSLTPLQLLLQKCLYPHIQARYNEVSTALLQILKEDYHMLDYFAAMRRFFLMEAGDIMYDFYTEIFDKLRLHEPWQDISFLNSTLQEALHAKHPQEADRVFVSVENVSEKRKGQHLISTLQGLTLHYKVPWPVDIVIHSRSMHLYNQVFSFLLQIKRVKYSLDELRFSDLAKRDITAEPDPEQRILGRVEAAETERRVLIHRVQVFRMKLLHFVNSLHNYIMTRILHSTGLEFQLEMSEAKDLDQIIAAHHNYVSRIHERCLLHRKVTFIKDIVSKVLDLSLLLALKWDDCIDSISEKQLDDMESKFARCIQFLSSFLNNIIKRGSFPHLESLAFALVSSNEGLKAS